MFGGNLKISLFAQIYAARLLDVDAKFHEIEKDSLDFLIVKAHFESLNDLMIPSKRVLEIFVSSLNSSVSVKKT